jgi:CHAT domain-containing protein
MLRRLCTFLFLAIFACYAGNAQPWIKADELRMKHLLGGRLDSALYYAGESVALIRGIKGENNPEYAKALDNIAVSYFHLGNYAKAKYFILKEVALWESLKPDDERAYLSSLENASVICRRTGDYEQALVQIKKADKKSLKLNGSGSAGYARTLSCFGGVCYDMGVSVNDMVYLKKAEEYFEKADLINTALGEKGKYAGLINKSDEAFYNNDIGNLPAAEALLQYIVSNYATEFGDKSTPYASALNNIGVLYFNSGNYKQAEKCLVEAAGIYTASEEAGSAGTAICISNLGALYHDMGNYARSEKMFNDARKVFEAGFQQNSQYYAILLNNIASVLITKEYYANTESKDRDQHVKSGRLFHKADSIFTLNCPNQHPDGFAIKCNLSFWYLMNGEKKKAVQVYYNQAVDANLSFRVVAMMNKMESSALIPFRPEEAERPVIRPIMIPVKVKMMNDVSAASSNMNSSGESDALTSKLVEMILGKGLNLKNAVGEYHPAYAAALKELTMGYAAIDDIEAEEEMTLEYMNAIKHKTLQDFSFLSETEKELYYQTRLGDVNSFTAYCLKRKMENPAITIQLYNNILLFKGLMLKSSTAMRVAILGSKDTELLKSYDEWISLLKEISTFYSVPVELRTKNLDDLEKQANDLEKALVAKSQDFSDYRKGFQITWEEVKKNLKPDEAAIEFTDYKKHEKDGGDAVIYAALIVRPDSKYPEMIKLFNEDQLESIIGSTGLNSTDIINRIYGGTDARLYNLIWKPIEEYLKGIKNVYISPSGLLFRISFPAISNGSNTYLCDNYRIQVEGSTGNISSKAGLVAGNQSALIFGGIRYSNKDSGSEVWDYLEGTKSEGDAITNILKKGSFTVQYLTENNATETFFKQNAGNYNFLHLATHGFFFDDPNNIRFEEKKETMEYGAVTFRGASRGGFGVSNFVNNSNPLMRSGLVLAGANDVWVKTEQGTTDDGVLTAQEVTQIDMRKNNLVVLSACETGLGDIKGTEGVYGLQRALKMAGVKNIIMSLWQIPDKETVEFMGKFYEKFLAIKDIRQAFSEAQHEMRLKYNPYYWGAFVLME